MARDKSAQLLSSNQAAHQSGDIETNRFLGQTADGGTGRTLRTLWCRAERPSHRKETSCPTSSKSLISTMNRRSRVGPTICRHSHRRPGPPASIPELHRSVPSFRTGLTSRWTLWQTSPRTLTSFRCSRSELAFRAEPPQSEPSSGLLLSRCRTRRGTRWVPASHDGRPSTSETDSDAEESAHADNQLRPGGPHQDSIDSVI